MHYYMKKKSQLISLFLLLLGVCSCSILPREFEPAKNIVVAHRGAWKQKEIPENSIASLEEAIEKGFTGSEFDVRMTLDSVLVVFHDPHYQNMEIRRTNYSDLVKFKLANGEKLPTLEEYIRAGSKKNHSTGLVCEIKPVKTHSLREYIAREVLGMVDSLKARPYINSYISFDYQILKEISKLDNSVKTQYLGGNKSPDDLKSDGITGLDYHMQVYKDHPKYISKAKELNLSLNVWTVNKVDDMKWFYDRGFDYITTDEPDILIEIEASNSGRP